MSSPSSRQNLIDYCLRSLGFPVLEINIDDDQIEDRIDASRQDTSDTIGDIKEEIRDTMRFKNSEPYEV
jgi:hypothetical protein